MSMIDRAMKHFSRIYGYLLVAAVLVAAFSYGTTPVLASDVLRSPFLDIDPQDPAMRDFAIANALGIIEGDQGLGGLARPNDFISREEMVAVVIRLMGKEASAHQLSNARLAFTDASSISPWARGYIALAHALGVVEGYPDRTFRPKQSVTRVEALAMIVRTMNNEEAIATDGWPSNYISYGLKENLFEGVAGSNYELAALRRDVVKMIVNAASVGRDYSSLVKDYQTPPLLNEYIDEGIVTRQEGSRLTIEVEGDNPRTPQLELKYELNMLLAKEVVLKGADAVSDLLFAPVFVVWNDQRMITYIETEAEVGTSGRLDDPHVLTERNGETWLVTEGKRLFEVDKNTVFLLNGERVDGYDDLQPGDWIEVSLDNRDVAIAVKAERYNIVSAVLTEEPVRSRSSNASGRIGLLQTSEGRINILPQTTVMLHGREVSFLDLQAGDILDVQTRGGRGSDAIRIDAVRQIVDGRIDTIGRFSSKDGIRTRFSIDGQRYELYDEADASKIAIGNWVRFRVDRQGRARVFLNVDDASGTVLLLAKEKKDREELLLIDLRGKEHSLAMVSNLEITMPDGAKEPLEKHFGHIIEVDIDNTGRVAKASWVSDGRNGLKGRVYDIGKDHDIAVLYGEDNKLYVVEFDHAPVYKLSRNGMITDYIGGEGLWPGDKVQFVLGMHNGVQVISVVFLLP